MKTYGLYMLSFNGDYVKDSEHETIESIDIAIENMGSKWISYPWPFIVKGQTVKAIYGSFIDLTGESYLNIFLRGKRCKTICKIFKDFYERNASVEWDSEQFELMLIHYLDMKKKLSKVN